MATPAIFGNKPCADCGLWHYSFMDRDSYDFWVNEMGMDPEDVEQWSADSKETYVPPKETRDGRPPALAATQEALKNRDAALRAYHRKKALAAGEPVPEWAQVKRRGRKAKDD